MDESILNTIKKMLGIEQDYDVFDSDIIVFINSALFILTQHGVGPSDGLSISDSTSKWSDFLQDSTNLNAVQSYVYMRVRVAFDPPTSSFVLDSLNKQIAELEWRLNVQVENT